MTQKRLRTSQRLIIGTFREEKVGAQTCKSQALTVIRSKVIWFTKYLLSSYFEVNVHMGTKRHNFRTELIEGLRLAGLGTNFPFATRFN